MLKVLIIDDEESVREAIKILGEWKKHGVDTILEARDGKEGSKILCEEKPDIVFLDMRMPEMNGVEFLQAAEKDYPLAVNIVISGYDDFEFTRQAIKSKVFDYLLKPVNRGQLNGTLEKAVESIRKQREKQADLISRSMEMNLSLHTLKEKIFLSAIEGSFHSQINETYLKMIGVEDLRKCYGTALFRIMNMTGVCAREFGGEADLMFFALSNITTEICNEYFEHFCCKNPRSDREIIIIPISGSKNPEQPERLTRDALTRVSRKLRELFGIVAVFGTGGFQSGLDGLSVSYQASVNSLYGHNLLNLAQQPVPASERGASAKSPSLLSKMTLIRSAIESGNVDYASGILNDHLNKIKEASYLSLRDANKILNEYIFMLNDITLEMDFSGSRALQDKNRDFTQIHGEFLDYTDFAGYRKLFTDITVRYYDDIRKSAPYSQKLNTRDIKDYIDKNYFQEIRISMFTEKYFLSKVYIMKLFKQDYGMSIYDYVQKVRMERAKELLKDPKVNIQNISQMVGYSNNNYFSKAFKTYFHISPSEYRIMVVKARENTRREPS